MFLDPIPTPMNNHTHIMSVDKTTIRTSIRLHPELINNTKAYVEEHDLSPRTIKPTKGKLRNGQITWKLALDVLSYRGIRVQLEIPDSISARNGEALAKTTIEFNPGKCLYGHNGRMLTLTEFLDALATLVTCLTPLLHDPKDWVDLVPGLRAGSPAYWHYMEVPFQCRDVNGALLNRLRHGYHPSCKQVRHWPNSIEFGSRKSGLQLSIYSKSDEMVSRNRLDLSKRSDVTDILRLELRMRASNGSKADRLIKYLGSESNTALIDGVKRLVKFFPYDLVRAFRTVFGGLQGIYLSGPCEEGAKRPLPLVALGRMLAQVAAGDQRSQFPFPALLNTIRHYTGASSETIRAIRKAGLARLSQNSTVTPEDLFSDHAFATQFGIASEELEDLICLPNYDTDIHRLVSKAYSPPSQPFRPHIELPGYMH